MSRVGVVGAGYVGLTTAACLADLGHDVVCGEVDPAKLERLARGELPIVERGLGELVTNGRSSGRLRFVQGAAGAAADRDVVFLCVATPQGDDGAADLTDVRAAAREVAPVLAPGTIVVTKSTVPVGTSALVTAELARTDVSVVSNPEFLSAGSAVHDFMHPDRIVVGSVDRSAAEAVAALYDRLDAPVLITDPASAETIKYAANSFLATKLSYVNSLAAVCEAVGADIDLVVAGLGMDRRIGSAFLKPGPGWGGSCFPKDTRALVRVAADAGYRFDLLEGVLAANESQFDRVVDKVRGAAGGHLDGVAVGVWGLTFKALTDDLRASPAVEVTTRLVREGARVSAYDPTVRERRPGVPDRVTLAASALEAVAGASVLVVLTEWDEFRWAEPAHVAAAMAVRAVVDGRNLLDRSAWRAEGFSYQGIGR